MEYYAAALREDGACCRGTDGLMVKGYKLCNGEKLVVMAYCNKGNFSKRFKRKHGGLLTNRARSKMAWCSDRMIRKLEAGCEDLFTAMNIRLLHGEVVKGNEVEDFLEETIRKLFKKRKHGKRLELSVVCLYGQKVYAFSGLGNGIYLLNNHGISEMKGFSDCQVKNFMSRRGFISESQTILMGSDSFFQYMPKDEIHMNLYPQMCMDNESMERNLEDIAKGIRGRSGGRAFSAVALCVETG